MQKTSKKTIDYKAKFKQLEKELLLLKNSKIQIEFNHQEIEMNKKLLSDFIIQGKSDLSLANIDEKIDFGSGQYKLRFIEIAEGIFRKLNFEI